MQGILVYWEYNVHPLNDTVPANGGNLQRSIFC